MSNAFARYTHHGVDVWVRVDLKGEHREHCLCHVCDRFKPGQADNCKKAQLLYAFCVAFDMTTPVWECPDFSEPKPTAKKE